MMLVLVLMACCTKRHSRKRCKSGKFVLPCFRRCYCCCCCNCCRCYGGGSSSGGSSSGGCGTVGVGVRPDGTLDKYILKEALQVQKARPAMSLLLLLL